MAKISFVDHNGETRIIDVENGATVMEAAIRNAIPGIEAECGGACACATCHVYVDEAWRGKVGAPSPMEEDMLDFGFDVRPNSRLSCQIKVSTGRIQRAVRRNFCAFGKGRCLGFPLRSQSAAEGVSALRRHRKGLVRSADEKGGESGAASFAQLARRSKRSIRRQGDQLARAEIHLA